MAQERLVAMKTETVSFSVVRRLPRYYRFLSDLHAAEVTRISSRQLAELMGITSSQIRQDLNCFGGFGQQGYGYNVEQLHSAIGRILGLDGLYPTVLIGAGNLGRAIGTKMDFEANGFRLIGAFDQSPEKIGKEMRNLTVQDVATLAAFCREDHPLVAMICLPPDAAKAVCAVLYEGGVRAFWNFSHYNILADYPDAAVENVHLEDSLMTLCYRLTHPTGAPEQDET